MRGGGHPALSDGLDIVLFLRVEALAGAELSMFRVVEDLQARGLRVLSALYGSAPGRVAQAYPGLNVLALPVRRTRSAILPLARLLRLRRPRVLISALTMTNCAAILGARLSGTPTRVIQTEHNPVVVRFRHDGARRAAYIRMLRSSYTRADAVVAVSSGVAREIEEITRSAVSPRVIYNPVVDGELLVSPGLPHPWLDPREPPCIFAMGRLSPEKGYPRLLAAFANLVKRAPCRMIILGEGAQRGELEQLRDRLNLGASVLLPGFVAHPKDWIQHGSLYVCSSEYEGFGNALVEALECGVPVVSTDCPFGPGEILGAGRWGRLVPLGRTDLLADAMADVLRRPFDKAPLRERAATFSRARSADGYAKLVSEFM